jgi:acyl-CoA thioesterase-1
MFLPATTTSPVVAVSSPAATIKSDDLPDPDGPSTATASPAAISSDTPESMLTGPATLESVRCTSFKFTTGAGRCIVGSESARRRLAEIADRRYCIMSWVFKLRRPGERSSTKSVSAVSIAALIAASSCVTFAHGAFSHPVRILAFGTSLTQGYGLPPGTELTALIETRLRAAGVDARLINAGVSGDTSADGLARVDWSLAERPDAAIVEFGGNDALRGLAPEETERNLSAILSKLKARNIPVLVLGMMAPRNLGSEYAAQFDAIYPALAKQYGTLFYPFVLNGVAMDAKLNQPDGIHPNQAGEKIVADRIFPDVLRLARLVRTGSR